MAALAEVIENATTEVNKDATESVLVTGKETTEKVHSRGSEGKEETVRTEEVQDSDKTEADEKRESEELTDDEIRSAKEVFKALKDPNQAPQLVRILAEQAGYIKPPETKQEAKEQAKDIVEKLKEAAGPELEFLIEKIGPVIKAELKAEVESVRTELRTDQVNRENEKLINETTSAMKTLSQKYYSTDEFPKDVQKEMTSLMNKINPSNGMKPSEYIEMLYFTAAGKMGIDINKTKQTQRVVDNRNDTLSRLSADRGAKAQEVKEVPRRISINEAVSKAVEAVERGEIT